MVHVIYVLFLIIFVLFFMHVVDMPKTLTMPIDIPKTLTMPIRGQKTRSQRTCGSTILLHDDVQDAPSKPQSKKGAVTPPLYPKPQPGTWKKSNRSGNKGSKRLKLDAGNTTKI